MKNKRGISAVVATVLIILITVAAVTIIWTAIIPMIKDQLTRGTMCLDAMTALSIENKGWTCYDNSKNAVKIQVKHGSKDIGLVGLQILVSESGSTTLTEINSSLPGPNEERVLSVTYNNNTPEGASGVSIAPIVKVGNAKEVCDATAIVTLDAC